MRKFFWVFGITGFVLGSVAQEVKFGTIPESIKSAITEKIDIKSNAAPLTAFPATTDTFATYVFTTQNIVVFAYEDSTALEVRKGTDEILWSGLLNNNQNQAVYAGMGVFLVRSNKKYSVLVGDPLRQDCYGWYAVDQNNRGVSTRLLTYFTPSLGMAGTEFIVFAYEDSTTINVYDLNSGDLIVNGTIDSAQVLRSPATYNRPVMVEADKGVSALTYSDQGYWVPSRNGTFAGQLFHAWIGNVGPWTNDLNICSYNNETHVKVTMTTSGDVIWEGDLDDGEVHTVIAPNQLVTVQSSKNVTCLIAPFVSYTGSYYRLYIGMDGSGEGIGTKFYHPSIAGAQLYIFSFYNGNQVRVYDQKSKSLLWSGKLNAGEYQLLSTMNTVYRIESDKGVAMYDAWGDIAGADFAPLWFAVHPEVALLPDQERTTEAYVPTQFVIFVENNGNYYDIVDILHSNTLPEHFTSEISTLTGDTLPDRNLNKIPDTDTLEKGGSFGILVDVSPSDTVPFGTADTTFLIGISFQDTTKVDTAFLVTYIRRVDIHLDSNSFVNIYPGDTAVITVLASNTSYYREDTVNLSWTSTKPADWPVKLTDITGTGLYDSDGDSKPDVSGVLPLEEPSPFQVRIGVPDNAMAGDQDTVYVVGTSANYPLRLYPTATDTVRLIVNVLPVPAILIRPDYTDSVRAGDTIRYTMEVLNSGNGPDVPDIEFSTIRPGWNHRLATKDGSGNLADTDTDGTPDIGTLPGLSGGVPGIDSFIFEVNPPYGALPGQLDTSIVYAYSSLFDTVYDSAIVVTKVRGVVKLDIEPDAADTIRTGDDPLEARYILEVTNWGGAPDTVEIWSYASPDIGWTYTLTDTLGGALTDYDGDGVLDVGSVDSAETKYARLTVQPQAGLGGITGDFDTTVIETRFVCIRTRYTGNPNLVNDSVRITTFFEPRLDIHNYPNPFRTSTTFAYSIPSAGYVSLKIYNRAGEHVRTVIDNEHFERGGMFETPWDGLTSDNKRPAPGVYLYTLEWTGDLSKGLIKTRRVVKKALKQ